MPVPARESLLTAMIQVLLRGCRCIEIDVWNGESLEHGPLWEKTAPSIASSTARELKEKLDHAKDFLSFKSHRHVPSITEPDYKAPDIVTSYSAVDDNVQRTHPDGHMISTKSSRANSCSSVRSSKHEPRVLHGWTLTADIGFREVCIAIRESAFVNSNLPVIVSLEVHADLEQQEVMVDIMKEEWAGILVDEAHPLCNPDVRQPLLEEILGKILVKVKKATQVPALQQGASVESRASTLSLAPSNVTEATYSSDVSDSEESRRVKPSKKSSPVSKICENLSRLGIYTHSEHFHSFHTPAASQPPHIFSIAEGDILDLHERERREMWEHNRSFFMRAYPSGRRINSSNPDPSVFWRKGVQMVALNFQVLDEGTMVNQAMVSLGSFLLRLSLRKIITGCNISRYWLT